MNLPMGNCRMENIIKFKIQIFFVFFLILGTLHPVIAQESDTEGSKDHSLVERMLDFYIGRSEQIDLDQETFKTDYGNIKVQGKSYYIDYRLYSGKNSPGKLEILNYYQTKLSNSNVKMLLNGPYYDVYKIINNDGETWVKIDPGVYDGKRYEVTIIESVDKTDFTNMEAEIIKTDALVMTGLNPADRIIKTGTLQMTGLNPNDRIIKTSSLEMTGLKVEDRIIKTSTLEMTGAEQ